MIKLVKLTKPKLQTLIYGIHTFALLSKRLISFRATALVGSNSVYTDMVAISIRIYTFVAI